MKPICVLLFPSLQLVFFSHTDAPNSSFLSSLLTSSYRKVYETEAGML